MTAQNPNVPMMPFNPSPTVQHVLFDEETLEDGTKVIKMLVIQPCTTTMILLTHDAARKLADQLFTRANGLQIARDMPGGTT